MNKTKRYLAAMYCILPLGFLSCMVNAQQPEVIKLQETIRGNQEQQKVMSTVPWRV
ncbi:MAG: hypothetical protein ACI9LX_001250 [Paraglaciecola sp.]|jgi:hypothetical protein